MSLMSRNNALHFFRLIVMLAASSGKRDVNSLASIHPPVSPLLTRGMQHVTYLQYSLFKSSFAHYLFFALSIPRLAIPALAEHSFSPMTVNLDL